jgi:hypothetical protein
LGVVVLAIVIVHPLGFDNGRARPGALWDRPKDRQSAMVQLAPFISASTAAQIIWLGNGQPMRALLFQNPDRQLRQNHACLTMHPRRR